jgi:hypothetical protein
MADPNPDISDYEFDADDLFKLGLQLPMLSVSITTKVSSANPVHGVVNSIQLYVIEVVRDFQQVVVSSSYSL